MAAETLPDPEFVSWHTLSLEESLKTLQSDLKEGLTSQQVEERLRDYGFNELDLPTNRNIWKVIVEQFQDPTLWILIFLASLSFITDYKSNSFPKDSIVILFFVVIFYVTKSIIGTLTAGAINAFLINSQEVRAERSLKLLDKRSLALTKVRVVRNGKIIEIVSRELVPGDVLLIDSGEVIPVDGRLLKAVDLRVKETVLTGETSESFKAANVILPEETPQGERANLVFAGTVVSQGRATVLVANTGMRSELGKALERLKSIDIKPTRLQRRLSQISSLLFYVALILVILIIVTSTILGGFEELPKILENSLSLVVAIVPEGMPVAVTISLSLGIQRMAHRNVLIKNLSAVEELGSITTVCLDKTGTLTQNKMVVQLLCTSTISLKVTGEGYASVGKFYAADDLANALPIAPTEYVELLNLLAACVLCNDASLRQQDGQWVALGDSTEGALLAAASKAGLERSILSSCLRRVAEFSFSSTRKRMSVILEVVGSKSPLRAFASKDTLEFSYLIVTKGSPELILEKCTRIQVEEEAQILEDEQRMKILQQHDQIAERGLRVVGFAFKGLSEIPSYEAAETTEQDLIWLGLVAMYDPPIPSISDVVSECRNAGIRPLMLTGDHQLTAQAIAEEVGIIAPDDNIVLTGFELNQISQAELEKLVVNVNVYARITPEHKLRIVQALQRQGEVVAMIGDGINDAFALKQADIGITMRGTTETVICRTASDMVLLDSELRSFTAGVEEGRTIYLNIRRALKYVLGSNIGEVVTVLSGTIVGVGTPLNSVQLLWMSMVTDNLMIPTLEVEPPAASVMCRPPLAPTESIFARGLGSYIVRVGMVFAIFSVALMVWSYTYAHSTPGEPERWRTMVFTTLCLAQMGHAITSRSNTRICIQLNPFVNPYILLAVVSVVLLQILLIYLPPLRSVFGTYYLSSSEFLVCCGFSILLPVWVELEKIFIRWYSLKNR